MKKKLVQGVGINDSDYVVEKRETIGFVNGKQKQKLVWRCKFYQTWTNMLMRCYSDRYQEQFPTYKNCTVSDEWLTFSNFRAWMKTQDWEGCHLDKDLLFDGNKVYSPDSCVFVSPMVNTFVLDSSASRGKCLIGVCFVKTRNKFQADCRNPFTKKSEFLGYHNTELEAHEKWKARKLELAIELAKIQTDPRVAKALIDRYS